MVVSLNITTTVPYVDTWDYLKTVRVNPVKMSFGYTRVDDVTGSGAPKRTGIGVLILSTPVHLLTRGGTAYIHFYD